MESQVRVLPSRYAPVTEHGIRAGIKVQILQVQILLGVLSSHGGMEDARLPRI